MKGVCDDSCRVNHFKYSVGLRYEKCTAIVARDGTAALALTPPRQLLHLLSCIYICTHVLLLKLEGLSSLYPIKKERKKKKREEIISGSVWPFGSRGVPHHRPSSAIFSA